MAVKTIDHQELSGLLKNQNIELIDVREPGEYKLIRYKQAKLIPIGTLPSRLGEIDFNKKVVIYCRTGERSCLAVKSLENLGYSAINLEGGIKACWNDNFCRSFLEINGDVSKYF